MLARIRERLAAIEKAHQVRIVFACESGSRAWGFPSVDSDYDVRFLYVHDWTWYLRLHEKRDVIEEPIEDVLDINGWDIRKALRLLTKHNPVLLEWLHSPIVYREDCEVMDAFRQVAITWYRPVNFMFHYYKMAKGNYREYLSGDEVWLKKYLYVLRPLLACKYIESGRGAPPMAFDALLDATLPAGELRQEIGALVARKKEGEELAKGPAVGSINAFIQEQLPRMETLASQLAKTRPGMEEHAALDAFFREILLDGKRP